MRVARRSQDLSTAVMRIGILYALAADHGVVAVQQ